MKHTYESKFAPYILGLIQQKQSDGFIYDTEAYTLKKFDDFCVEHYTESDTITRDIVSAWGNRRSTENSNTQNRRLYTLRQLCLYICSLGIESYIPSHFSSKEKSVLYIPSHEEMQCFFSVLDSLSFAHKRDLRFPYEHRMLFRLYYCCGLRLSEAVFLKKENVDFDKGILKILNAKGHKDRLVYLPEDGIDVFKEYLCFINKELPSSPWLFPGLSAEKALCVSTVWTAFKRCWKQTPYAGKTDKAPSVHCLRHAFVVKRINDWMAEGIDLQTMLSHLSSYLGHKSPSETFYYYHLVNKAFTVIREKDTISKQVIPEVIRYEE